MKKKWKKPELIELYRGRPDENLLEHVYCKGDVAGRNAPDRAVATLCEFDQGSRAGDPCFNYLPS